MSHQVDEEGPIYYREIQKNGYLKRLPDDDGGKLKPLMHKKPPPKPLWTVFCVHNGRTPYLEQYIDPHHPSTMAHKPLWRASLKNIRHVTSGLRPKEREEHEVVFQTDQSCIRMLAVDWETSQSWVSSIRSKLSELRVLGKGENVYCSAPPPPAVRAPARDPTSPLPPVPGPVDRVPGIELITPALRTNTQTILEQEAEETTDQNPSATDTEQETTDQNDTEPALTENIDISDWESHHHTSLSNPSTSNENLIDVKKNETRKSVAKICGQNICLDDSILRRNYSDDDAGSFIDIDSSENVDKELISENENVESDFKQTLLVNDVSKAEVASAQDEGSNEESQTNITVIRVLNKDPPHTAIPVINKEDVFNFDFKQKLTIEPQDGGHFVHIVKPEARNGDNFVNIVNTEVNISNPSDEYGTLFPTTSEYGHLSLTTTVNLEAVKNTEGVYERLCMASTSIDCQNTDSETQRNNSLPNLTVETSTSSRDNYEFVFPNTSSQISRTPQNTNVIQVKQNGHRQESESQSATADNLPNTSRQISQNSSTVLNSTTVNVNRSLDSNVRVIRSSVERSHSQNSYDSPRRNRVIRRENSSKIAERIDKQDIQPSNKPIWKRGLTELSLLSRLRGLGQSKRAESPTRKDDRLIPQSKVVHRARQEASVDGARRRSNSLTNASLPYRLASSLLAQQSSGAAVPVRASHAPVLAAHDRQLWVASWGPVRTLSQGRAGDRVAAVRGEGVNDLARAKQLMAGRGKPLDILFHRVPLAKVYVLVKERPDESIGIKLESDCTIVSVASGSPADRGGVTASGGWAVTEVNNRPINLVKGCQDDLVRLSACGKEVLILIQPAALVRKLRAALKSSKNILSMR